jgi:hypothetical protein
MLGQMTSDAGHVSFIPSNCSVFPRRMRVKHCSYEVHRSSKFVIISRHEPYEKNSIYYVSGFS